MEYFYSAANYFKALDKTDNPILSFARQPLILSEKADQLHWRNRTAFEKFRSINHYMILQQNENLGDLYPLFLLAYRRKIHNLKVYLVMRA